ncbi:hypothetical protein DFJ73DRAFT_965537 [Zopfochytrium polystomum]|nr:hypothetical protein DFJ73DRAFT_965537 [Zopfochytrium polystomum]
MPKKRWLWDGIHLKHRKAAKFIVDDSRARNSWQNSEKTFVLERPKHGKAWVDSPGSASASDFCRMILLAGFHLSAVGSVGVKCPNASPKRRAEIRVSRMISSPVVRPKIHPSMAGRVTVQDQPRCRLLGPAAAAAAAEPSCGLGDFRRGVDARKPLRVRLFHAAGEGRSRRQEYSWQGFSERCSPACREHDPHRARGTVMGVFGLATSYSFPLPGSSSVSRRRHGDDDDDDDRA